MTEPKFNLGDDVFVHDPNRYARGCVSITGDVVEIQPIGSSFKYWLMAEVIYPYNSRQRWLGRFAVFEVDLGHRLGTPLSQLDGRGGGNAEWRRISESWGYP